MNLPRHLAIIMDGNGRWANARRHNRIFGHVRGARVAKKVIEDCSRIGIDHLTLFAFSHENWLRPDQEVNALMLLLRKQLKNEVKNLIENNIRFHCIGEIERLPEKVRRVVESTIKQTAHCNGMTLTFALSYGGRQEILSVTKRIAELVAQGDLQTSEIDEELISRSLSSHYLPDPDAIIRTSGEKRLSNFMLWQSAYSEFIEIKKMWPDFTTEDLTRALAEYSARNRRFGKVSEETISAPPQ